MRISFEVQGKKEFDRTFIRMDFILSDMSLVAEDIRDEFWKIQTEQFNSEGEKGRSGAWKPLNKRYAKTKAKLYPRAKILERTGRAKKSLTGQTADTVFKKSKDEVIVGSSVPYIGFHQQGSGKLPKREPISFSDNQRRRLMKSIQKGSGKLPKREPISFSDNQRRRLMKSIQKGLVREMRKSRIPVTE